ncbi:hypothetical protein KR215_002108 [Drosophila sulfurigaster]|nr:hypothetical protein KR215_002108 [Drosophila sulfurigaster]
MVSFYHLTILLCACGSAASSSQQNTTDFNIEEYQRMMQLRHLAIEFFDYYENITTTDLIVPGSRLPNQQDLLCLSEVAQLSLALRSGQLWALRMIDSWGRLPAGMLYGNMKDLGNFEECIRVNHALSTTGQTLRGKYCFAKLLSGSMLGSGSSAALSLITIQTAVCFPASCTGDHMETLLRRLFQQLLNIELNAEQQLIDDDKCKTAESKPLDGIAILTIVIIAVLAAAVLLSTLYDYFCCEDQTHLPLLAKIFSARVNSRALFRVADSKTNPNVIDCLHGIRCLSLVWVVYGHDYLKAALSPIINLVDVLPWYRSPYSMFITHGLFSVDSFFFLSGLLLVMVALRSMEKTEGKINVPLMYLHRYLRLTPVLALAILAYMKLLPLIGGGPVSDSYLDSSVTTCQDNWYLTLLYVQNYAANSDMCLGHSWYLSVDMQLYIISPLLLIALYKWGKKAVAGIVVLMLLLAGCLFATMVIRDYSMSRPGGKSIYVGTHVRASPWIIGLLLGYFLHVKRGKTIVLNRWTVWLGWISCLVLIFISLFALYPYPANGYTLPILNEAFYVTLTRISWPLALAWIVFACKYGYGGLANSFLSSAMWQPLSKLSYCVYIWHVFIQNINGGNAVTSTYFSDYQVMLRFWSDFGFSVLLAYCMYILIEAPSGGLQLLFLSSGKPKTQSSPPLDAPKVNDPTPQLEAKATLDS